MNPTKVSLVFVTTVPQTLEFYRHHISYLVERGYKISLISSFEHNSGFAEYGADVVGYSVPMTREITPIKDFISLTKLWITLIKIKPDIVHLTTPKAGLIGAIAARMARVPVVYLSIFGLPQITMVSLKKWIMDIFTKISCRLSNRVWCDSASMKALIVREGICTSSKAVTLGNGSVCGVDAKDRFSVALKRGEEVCCLRRELGIPTSAIILGYVGRIVRDKGIHELMVAWKALRTSFNELHLIIVGAAEDKGRIWEEDSIVIRTDSHIHQIGFTRDVPKYMALMDVFVMPSHREGFGVTNIEAAAMGIPVVSTRIPGCIDSVADGETGLLVPPGDYVRLAEAIKTYVDSPDLRISHGLAGRQRVLRDFRPEILQEALFKEYHELIKNEEQSKNSFRDMFIWPT